jgi:outer membrane protein OmpA-like peptidoglycan-associated protein
MAYDRSLQLLITGFADRRGNPEANLELSKRRALKVKEYLVAQGISSNRLTMNFFGDADSRYENPDDRKVEVTFMRF